MSSNGNNNRKMRRSRELTGTNTSTTGSSNRGTGGVAGTSDGTSLSRRNNISSNSLNGSKEDRNPVNNTAQAASALLTDGNTEGDGTVDGTGGYLNNYNVHEQKQQLYEYHYNVCGDTNAAYKLLLTKMKPIDAVEQESDGPLVTTITMLQQRYNQLILSELRSTDSLNDDKNEADGTTVSSLSIEEVLKEMDNIETSMKEAIKGRDDKGIDFEQSPILYTLQYNRALIHFGISNYVACIDICYNCIAPQLLLQKQKQNEQSQTHSANSTTNDEVASNVMGATTKAETQSVLATSIIVLYHMTFLFLECLLTYGIGRNNGLNTLLLQHAARITNSSRTVASINDDDTEKTNTISTLLPTINLIVQWLDDTANEVFGIDNSNTDTPDIAQIRFLIPLYKSRINLSDFGNIVTNDPSTGNKNNGNNNYTRVERSTRYARKDMKTAMEIFHNKLRPAYSMNQTMHTQINETDSVTSSVNSTTAATNAAQPLPKSIGLTTASTSNSNVTGTTPLMKLNQSALYVKAHLEQLKGNTKKSLILCSEAFGTNMNTASPTIISANSNSLSASSSYDTMVHDNNLAVVYSTTNDSKFLALHAMTKALQYHKLHSSQPSITNTLKQIFHSDGTVKMDTSISTALYYNTSICCLRTRKFLSAYICMVYCLTLNYPTTTTAAIGDASVITENSILKDRIRCYLRLSEACIGMYSEQLQNKATGPQISMNGEGTITPNRTIIDLASLRHGTFEGLADLGSPDDIEQVQRNPLPRAYACLQYVLQSSSKESQLEDDAVISARLSLCYIELAFGTYRKALTLAKMIIDVVKDKMNRDDIESNLIRRLHKRQLATANIYASEACGELGFLQEAMTYINGDGNEIKLNQLASDLSGVSTETISANDDRLVKQRIANAQATVQSLASSISVAMGNTTHVTNE